ncbi:MAG: hypothetical protein WEF53_06270 [Bacteroidota bacterium]
MVTRLRPFVFFVAVSLLFGCSTKTPEGVFYSKRDWEKKRYIELKSDGSFFLKQQRQVVGKFEAEEGGITLVFEGGQADRWRMHGDTLVGGGDTYVLWSRGENGFQFEEIIDNILSKTANSIYEGRMTQEQAIIEKFDLFVAEGFMSREEADKEVERMKRRGKDAIVSDLTNLAANAYQYRIRPRTMGGGGGSYIGYSVPPSLSSNENATYSASVSREHIIFTGTSRDRQGSVSARASKDGRLSGWQYKGKFE